MPTVNLTAKMLENLTAPDRPGQRIEYFDDTVPGFGVRVTHDGRKTFTFLYRRNHERPIIAGLWELLLYTGVRPGTALAHIGRASSSIGGCGKCRLQSERGAIRRTLGGHSWCRCRPKQWRFELLKRLRFAGCDGQRPTGHHDLLRLLS
jgi:hypothetical protein